MQLLRSSRASDLQSTFKLWLGRCRQPITVGGGCELPPFHICDRLNLVEPSEFLVASPILGHSVVVDVAPARSTTDCDGDADAIRDSEHVLWVVPLIFGFCSRSPCRST